MKDDERKDRRGEYFDESKNVERQEKAYTSRISFGKMMSNQ